MRRLYSPVQGAGVLTPEAFALERCRALRKALMAYQDNCTDLGRPPIRFVWTSLTYLFDRELAQTGSTRQIEQISLNNLDEKNAWSLLGDTLQAEVAESATLQWAFQMCCGNPRAIVDGFTAEYHRVENNTTDGHIRLVHNIARACRFDNSHHPLVANNIFSVLTNTLPEKDKISLREQGALHSRSDESRCLNPALVYHWASESNEAGTYVARCIRDYFGADKLYDPKMFERQTLAYELLLHMAYAERKEKAEKEEKITVGQYLSPAFVEDDLKNLVINPRKDISFIESKSLTGLTSEELYNKLYNSCRIYSDNVSEAVVYSLVPLFLSKPGEEETLHLFCCQNKLVCEVEGLKNVETNVSVPAIKKLIEWCGEEGHDVSVHPLIYTAHEPGMKTKGVWFTLETMTKWFSRLGAAKISFRKRKRETEAEAENKRLKKANQGGSG